MKKIFIILFTLLFTNTIQSQISTEHQLKQANKAAVTWFNNLNIQYTNSKGETCNNYPQAYSGLSYEIKNRFDSLDWVLGVEQMMISFGDFAGRKEVSRKFRSNWEGTDFAGKLPDGYYVIFQYESKYKNTTNHSEQLILHQDHRSKWRILDFSYDFTEGEEYTE